MHRYHNSCQGSPCRPVIKQLMTGRKGKSEFCFLRPSMLEVEGKHRLDFQPLFGKRKEQGPRARERRKSSIGKQNWLFLAWPVVKCFVIPPNSKIEKKCQEIVCSTPAGPQICPCFTELTRPHHMRVESTRQLPCFVRRFWRDTSSNRKTYFFTNSKILY